MAEASDFNIGTLGFAKAHSRFPHRTSGVALGWAVSQIWGFPFHISATAEANDFKMGIIKARPEKVAVALG